MIEIFGLLLLLAFWFAIVLASFTRFFDAGHSDPVAWILAVVALWGLAAFIHAGMQYEQRHPCVAYESRMTYNAATKTMMPLRVCVERGEWE